MVNNCRETFPWAGRFSCLQQRIRAAARELDDKEEEFWMAGLLPPRLLLLLYGQNITTTSFPLPLYLICKLQYKFLLLLPSRAEMVVYHILKCLARLRISQTIHPPSFSENHIFSDMEKEKKITFDTSMICFCYDVAIWRAGWVTSDPLFEQEKKPRHFYLSLCVFSLDSFACWGRHHLLWAILAWPIESPKILLFSFKVSPSFRQKGWMQSSISV